MDVTVASTTCWEPPTAAYVHVPFCRHRCGYCNFSVVAGRDDLAEAFLRSLQWELSQLGEARDIETLFIGGGTPTHLPPEWLERMLTLVGQWLRLPQDGEFSVEANPRDIDRERLDVLRAHGVNRISLGVQSFDQRKLQVLQRDHDEAVARDAVTLAAEAIGNVSIDLIFAAPEETPIGWQQDLDIACGLPITHLSTYALTYEKGTQFWTRRFKSDLRSADEATELEMYHRARRTAAAAGLPQYEISSFASRPNRCKHNIHYWLGRGWYGFGPGAAGFVDGRRRTNHRSPTTYIRRSLAGRSPVQEEDAITRQQWAFERAAFGVRMMDGVDLAAIARDTGVAIATVRKQEIEDCRRWGLVELRQDRLILTEKGIAMADTVSAALL
ncbi:radical SAM family heme chaperone HemW [Roseimaritima ulvae]|uniref:Heme chaperone HemW n=1 Tax=Roseimaritima ulvae TaxID=980254 RepID=A0A5B9R471_9BACT|nr:radical SAM family heme chaperone HemW [Roseimaritima ulvae]QEG41211.1 Oxygen-independent coproporphyrinogen-III oxidase-like protein [Roseimaritima ulvae]